MELDEGEAVFNHACRMGLDSTYRSGRSPDWLKMKNPACDRYGGGGGGLGTLRISGILVNFATIQRLVPCQYGLGQEHPYV
jgi:hypothetical protein